jgi:hypothetical protein
MRSRKSSGRYALHVLSAAVLTLGTAQLAHAAVFPEVEPNDTKATANPVAGLTAGDTLTGNSTGSSTVTPGAGSADYFLLTTAPQPLGIYRNRLVITSNTVGHTGSLRGLTQTAGVPNPTSDSQTQTTSTTTTPPRYNQFYTFGNGGSTHYRVTGAAATTADYTVTHEQTPITAPNIGAFAPGSIVIQTTGLTSSTSTALEDTDLWVYDAAFNAIPGYGNDDEPGGTGANALSSRLDRVYAPGTYYLAITDFGLVNNQPAAPDDDFQTGALADFPGVVYNSNTVIDENLSFRVTDSLGQIVDVTANKDEAFEVKFYQFTVVPEPGTIGILGAAGLGLLARRRRA